MALIEDDKRQQNTKALTNTKVQNVEGNCREVSTSRLTLRLDAIDWQQAYTRPLDALGDDLGY